MHINALILIKPTTYLVSIHYFFITTISQSLMNIYLYVTKVYIEVTRLK